VLMLLSQPNNDYCEACNGKGHFLCCDGCPRSFHFSCLDPPLELDTIPADAWYCKVCEGARVRLPQAHRRSLQLLTIAPMQNPPPRGTGFFGKLISKLNHENPTTFSLPKEITASFKNGEQAIASRQHLLCTDTRSALSRCW
jgi:hypothetical protein